MQDVHFPTSASSTHGDDNGWQGIFEVKDAGLILEMYLNNNRESMGIDPQKFEFIISEFRPDQVMVVGSAAVKKSEFLRALAVIAGWAQLISGEALEDFKAERKKLALETRATDSTVKIHVESEA